MANIFEKGTLYKKGEIKEGVGASGRPWARMTAVFDIPGGNNYSKKVAVDAGTEDVQTLAQLPIGTPVEICYAVSAREWEGRWFPCVNLVSLKVEESKKAAAAPASATKDPSLPDFLQEDFPED